MIKNIFSKLHPSQLFPFKPKWAFVDNGEQTEQLLSFAPVHLKQEGLHTPEQVSEAPVQKLLSMHLAWSESHVMFDPATVFMFAFSTVRAKFLND